MFGSFIKLYELFWRSPRQRKEAKITVLGDLLSFSGECESWLIQLHNLRLNDPDVAIGDEVREYLSEVSMQDSTSQKLQWNLNKEFGEKEIRTEVTELLRRISFTRQMLLFCYPEVRKRAFPHGLLWVKCQIAQIIIVAAESINMDVNDPSCPLFMGFQPLGMNCDSKYLSIKEPWKKIMFRTYFMIARMPNKKIMPPKRRGMGQLRCAAPYLDVRRQNYSDIGNK